MEEYGNMGMIRYGFIMPPVDVCVSISMKNDMIADRKPISNLSEKVTGKGKTCPECGASVDEDTRFCPQCGRKLK